MTPEQNKAICATFLNQAVDNFVADGHLTATLILIDQDDDGIVCIPGTKFIEHPPDAAAAVLLVTARAMDLSVGTVKSRLNTGLEQLRRRLR